MSWFDGGCAVDGLEKGCVDRIIGKRLRSWGDFAIKHCDKSQGELLNSIEFEKGDKGGGLRRLWEARGYKGKAGQLTANPNDVALPHVVFEMDTSIENREWDRHVFGDLREQEMFMRDGKVQYNSSLGGDQFSIDGTNVPWLNGHGGQQNVPAICSRAAHSGDVLAVAPNVLPYRLWTGKMMGQNDEPIAWREDASWVRRGGNLRQGERQ
ncbi:hypothetical protein B0H13DRAFT_1926321 [Mycena leptocephala]|nr:hypothetical protein B0H13DRAFT_1926321 [Mycena leptocephala]